MSNSAWSDPFDVLANRCRRRYVSSWGSWDESSEAETYLYLPRKSGASIRMYVEETASPGDEGTRYAAEMDSQLPLPRFMKHFHLFVRFNYYFPRYSQRFKELFLESSEERQNLIEGSLEDDGMDKLQQVFETESESKPDFYSMLCHAIRQMNPLNKISGWLKGVHAAARPKNVSVEVVDTCSDTLADMADSDLEERNVPTKEQPDAAELESTSDHDHRIDIVSSLCNGNDEGNPSAGDMNSGPHEIDGSDSRIEFEEGTVSECSLYSSRNATESDQIGPGRVLGNLVSVVGRAVEAGINRIYQKIYKRDNSNHLDAIEVVSVSIKVHTNSVTVSVVTCSLISSKTDTESNITGAGRVVGIAISWAGRRLENRINQTYGKVVQRRQADQNSRTGMPDTSPTRSRGKIRWADETANSSWRSKDMRKTFHGGLGHYPEHVEDEQKQSSCRKIAWRNAPGSGKARGLKWLRRI